jgi:DNA invertase Pin-like site-specific DNA recombinase
MVTKTKTALTPAVAYIRMSSLKQDASPEQQRQEAAKLAAANNCHLIREYADEGISGDNANRPGFQAMLRDAVEKRDFAAIICWDQDRFARFDSIKAGKYIDPLREAGVWLITKAQGVVDWNTFTGRMMYSIIQEGKHQYLLDLSRNVLRGRIASARKGQLIVQPAYGYDRVFYDEAGQVARRVPYGEKFNRPRGWTVAIEPSSDGEKVATVKWIMETFANGDCSIRGIAKDLNQRGTPAPRGRGWNANTVRYILAHRVYLGVKGFGERRGGKYHQIGDDGEIQTAKGKANRSAPIVADLTHEALVDTITFKRVQAKLADRATTSERPRTSDYILRGVLHCGHCGRAMCGQKPAKGSSRRYYRCPGANDGRCKVYSIRKEQIEGYVLGFLDKWLQAPESVEKVKAAIHRLAKSKRGFQGAARGLQTKISALDRKIAKGSENLLLADSANVPELSDLLGRWRKERDRLQADLEAAGKEPTGHDMANVTKGVISYIKKLREKLSTADPALVRAGVKELVADVSLFWEPDGERYRRVSKGIIAIKPPSGFVLDSSSTASARRPRETAALSRRPATSSAPARRR